MTKVRAKFICNHIENPTTGDAVVHMSAVTSGSEENKSFAEYTPSAQLQMHISPGTSAASAFEQGKEYFVDFTPAE